MLTVATRISVMNAPETTENLPEEILEDGEIEDDGEDSEEIITVTETVLATPKDVQGDTGDKSPGFQDHEERELDVSSEDGRKHRKKHQHRRKKHRDSKDREEHAHEKKERRKKRKLMTNDEGAGGEHDLKESSPHSRKKRKKKKHTRDRKDRASSSPDSYGSDDNSKAGNRQHYSLKRDYGSHIGMDESIEDYDDYLDEDPYSSLLSQRKSYRLAVNNSANNNSGMYYSNAAAQDYQSKVDYNSESASGSDFESQLADYRNYKTKKSNGDYLDDDCRNSDQYMSPSSTRKSHSRRRQYDSEKGSSQRSQRTKRSRWEQPTKSHSSSTEVIQRKAKLEERLSEQYDDQNYGESARRICKFFLENKCNKGSDCTFSHDLDTYSYPNQQKHVKAKKRELCKFYLAGYCHHGNNCTYMHSEYPCKYFHTGASCYAGGKCRFSHDPPTEETKEIIESLKDVYSNVDDSWEINELAKIGVKALSKPPPGVGLLPTPSIAPVTRSSTDTEVIPSLFDIQVAPTADLQKRIDENSVASLSMTDESDGVGEAECKESLNPRKPPYKKIFHPGKGLLPTPTSIVPSSLHHQSDGNSSSDGFYSNFYEGEHCLENKEATVQDNRHKNGASEDVIKTDDDDDFIRIDTGASNHEGKKDTDANVKAPDFLPATQKALFMRIHHKRASADQTASKSGKKNERQPEWTYSSDEEEQHMPQEDSGIIKIDATEAVAASTPISDVPSSSVETILKMITNKTNSSTTVDTNLLSKVASVINMTPSSSAGTSNHYNPVVSTPAVYNPAQQKTSPHHSNHSSSNHHQNHHRRERKSSGSSSSSPGHSSSQRHSHHHPLRKRLSTQDLSKEPVPIPLVSKQTGGVVHSTHPDPRMTLSRLLGQKTGRFVANLPRFSKDLILPGSGKMVGLKITLSAEGTKPTKRDPRLGRHKDPRLHKSSDPRLKVRSAPKTLSDLTETGRVAALVPLKPSALITKSAAVIPSLPELDLDLAHIASQQQEQSNEQNDTGSSSITNIISSKAPDSYTVPQHLKLPRLMKAPVTVSNTENNSHTSPTHNSVSALPASTIAPYDPRYMSSGATKSTASNISMSTAPYDPRVLSAQSSVSTGELKKRTIQLPKLTPAPTYNKMLENKNEDTTNGDKPEGDQGDF